MEIWVNNTKEIKDSLFYFNFEITMNKNTKAKTYEKFTFEIEEW